MRATLLFVAVAGCSGASPAPAPADGPPLERIDLGLETPNGLSGLAADEQGRLWVIPERDRVLLRIVERRVEARVPLEGQPEGLDTESLAYLGDSVFAAGTESMDEGRTSDAILLFRVEGERARVFDRIELPYSLLGVSAEENHGIEALCHVNGTLVAALENVRPSPRSAPLALYSLADRRWTAREVPLTTARGKLSGLACRERDGAIEAFAIERYFETMRVLRFDPTRSPIVPRVIVPLEGRLEGDPNLEGIELVPEGIVLVVDNHYGRVTGPDELVLIRHRP